MNELTLFNSLFDDFENDGFTLPSFNYRKVFKAPKVDVKEEDKEYTLIMDLPGKTDKDVKVELNGNVLTISSESKNEKEDKGDKKHKWLIKERSYSQFSRSFTLPEDVNADSLRANVKNGVLTVTMPRVAVEGPKKIAISYES